MSCHCDSLRTQIISASVELFHARMAARYKGKTVSVSGSAGWWDGEWNGTKWSGNRYEGRGTTATYSYSQGTITVTVGYELEDMGTWEDIYGSSE